MGQSAVILVLAATLTVGILVVAAMRQTNEADVELASYQYKVLAREAATTGMHLTARKLVDDLEHWQSDPTSYGFSTQTYGNARFTVVVTALHEDTVEVVSTGEFGAGEHIIEARYTKAFASLAVPPAFRYGVMGDTEVSLDGTASVRTLNDGLNANIHANGDLDVDGSRMRIEGYGTYGPSGTDGVTPRGRINQIFDPNVDSNGSEDNVYRSGDVGLPSLDPLDYADLPPASYTTASDTTLSGVVDVQAWATSLGYGPEVGTIQQPFLLYVNGDLRIEDEVFLLGYVQIVTYGDISIQGTVASTMDPRPDPFADEMDWDAWLEKNIDDEGHTKAGFYANGGITVEGNSTIAGQLFANNGIDVTGSGGQRMNIIGGFAGSRVDIDVSGHLGFRYAQVSTAVVLPGWTETLPDGIRLATWAEW